MTADSLQKQIGAVATGDEEIMSSLTQIVTVSLLGLAVTSSNMIGAALGTYLRPSTRLLACILAFAAGALITALAIELAYEGALDLHAKGFATQSAWLF